MLRQNRDRGDNKEDKERIVTEVDETPGKDGTWRP
jgi:hypothetical protein